ncbi:hypothetical protein [Paraburkholderia sp. BR13444]|uniref:hypothetical protein n=1 Tax=Paraburkholderia sp. BR13444 TaxID=3236997 RepID=UPI0034CE5FEA
MFEAIGSSRDMTFQEKQAVYEQVTGRSLEKDAEARKVSVLNGATETDLDKWLGTNDQSENVLKAFFVNRPTNIRVRDWGSVAAYSIFAIVGGAIFASIGWVVAGFALKRETP